MLEFTARKNQRLLVSNRQVAILVGCLLGDGYIHPRGQIQIAQSSKQSAYVDWKYSELCSLAYGLPSRIKRFDPRYGKTYEQSRFWLRQFFRPWRELFYPNGKKIIPQKILSYIDELSLAVWYMDDGNLHRNQITIATDGYKEDDKLRLQDMLLHFGVKSTISKSGKIKITAETRTRFFDLVKPHIHSSMIYKVP